MQCVYKCALRFSKGIEPRRAKEVLWSLSKIPIEFLFEKKKQKSFVGTRTDRKKPKLLQTQFVHGGVFRSLKQ